MSIELRDASYRYPGFRRWAIDGIDLAVADGEIVGLMGRNEAGKSTLCLVAAGLSPGSIGGELTGDVLLDGSSIRGIQPSELAGRVGIVFSNPASQRTGIADTVLEEVAFGPVNIGLTAAESAERSIDALEALGVADLALRAPDRLSGGQAQLVAIASMLAMGPRQLVLDEPTSELDADGRRIVVEAIRSVAVSGTAVLIAEHDRSILAALGARVVGISAGRLA